MIVTQSLEMHLDRPDPNLRIYGVRGDSYTREVQVALYENGAAWTLPKGLAVLIRYGKPDGTSGSYDMLPDGTAAWSGTENVLTIRLAPCLTECCGPVWLQLEMQVGDAVLSSFRFYLLVSDTPAE